MNIDIDLKQRLRSLGNHHAVAPLEADSFRDELYRRACEKKKQSTSPVVMALVAVILLATPTLWTQRTESVNFGLNLVGTLGHTLILQGDSERSMGSDVTRGNEHGAIPIPEHEIFEIIRRKEIFNKMHMAGLTQINYVAGTTILGRSELRVNYFTMIDSVRETSSEKLFDAAAYDTIGHGKIMAYLVERNIPVFLNALRGHYPSLPDTSIAVDGQPFNMKRFVTHDRVLDEVIYWFDEEYFERVSANMRVNEEVQSN